MLSQEEFVARAVRKHGQQFDYSASEYRGIWEPIQIRCIEHGEFQVVAKAHLSSKFGGCCQCAVKHGQRYAPVTADEFIERARRVHGERFDYRQMEFRNLHTPVVIVCPVHGRYQQCPAKHLNGQGCKRCRREQLSSQRRMKFWDFVERVIATHGSRHYDYEIKDFVNVFSKIVIRCPEHGAFSQSVASHLRGHGCPACVQSKGERRVRDALTALGVEFVEQARFPECCNHRPLPFDFFVPTHRLLIEFDGRQHFENSELWGGKTKLAETQLHDELKNQFAASHRYRLLRIPHWKYGQIEDVVLNELAVTEPTQERN